jgi:hypothetical protein
MINHHPVVVGFDEIVGMYRYIQAAELAAKIPEEIEMPLTEKYFNSYLRYKRIELCLCQL